MAKGLTEATKLIKTRLSLIDGKPKELIDKLPKDSKAILKAVQELLTLLDISDGHFTKPSEKGFNAIKTARVQEELSKVINNSSYANHVIEFLGDFDLLEEANRELYAVKDNLNILKAGISKIKRAKIDQVTFSLLQGGMDARFSQPVIDILLNAQLSGLSVIQAQKDLTAFITGGGVEQMGFFERYVPQIARDGIGQYDGAVQQAVKEEFNFNAISYEGSLISDSRPQCVRWVSKFGGVLRDDQLESEIAWAEKNGSGMYRDKVTNPDTFAIYRGGYACRHATTAINV